MAAVLEDRWLAAFHDGDRTVLEQCYREHYGAVAAAVRPILGDADAEFVLPLSPQVVSLADLEPGSARVVARGAASEAYSLVFSLPFDSDVVDTYAKPSETAPASLDPPSDTAAPWKRVTGWSAVGLGATGVGLGVALEAWAIGTARNAPSGESQAAASQRNARIGGLNTGAAVSYVAGGASLATGLVVLLWPDSHLRLTASPTAATLGYGGSF